jgi:hypothetical protein
MSSAYLVTDREYSIAHNAQTPLHRLPGEIRNKIWEYALGGHRFHGRKPYKRTPDTHPKPKNYFALQQVCRQIYAETNHLPFKLNEFYFVSEASFDGLDRNRPLRNVQNLRTKLLNVRRETITQVCIATSGAEQMAKYNSFSTGGGLEALPWAFPVDIFPGLKRVVVEVGKLEPMRYPQGSNKSDIERVEKAKTRLVEHIREHHKEVEIIFKGV